MKMAKLKYLSEAVVDQLLQNVKANLLRYQEGDFQDLEKENGWAIETTSVHIDHSLLASLEKGQTNPETEVKNSLIVYTALPGMTPSLAREERIWTRLTHIECLGYARSRWLQGKSGDQLEKTIRDHFFARSLTKLRDDNAVARLWWNAHIAKLGRPDSPEEGLKLLLQKADVRLNFVERTETVSRQPLARALFDVMETDPWVTAKSENFRVLMKILNRNGGGILFEAMPATEVNQFMETCVSAAKAWE